MTELQAFCQKFPEVPALTAIALLLVIYWLGTPRRKRPDKDPNSDSYNPFD